MRRRDRKETEGKRILQAGAIAQGGEGFLYSLAW